MNRITIDHRTSPSEDADYLIVDGRPMLAHRVRRLIATGALNPDINDIEPCDTEDPNWDQIDRHNAEPTMAHYHNLNTP